MIDVVVDDLAARPADAIVRPATVRLVSSTPAAERLDQAGGPAFTTPLALRRDLAVGAAVVTSGGGALPAEFVIHAVVTPPEGAATATGVARAWLSALQRAKEWQFARLTAPPLAQPGDGLTLAEVADIMVSTLRGFLDAGGYPQTVSLVVASEEEREVFTAALRRHPEPAA